MLSERCIPDGPIAPTRGAGALRLRRVEWRPSIRPGQRQGMRDVWGVPKKRGQPRMMDELEQPASARRGTIQARNVNSSATGAWGRRGCPLGSSVGLVLRGHCQCQMGLKAPAAPPGNLVLGTWTTEGGGSLPSTTGAGRGAGAAGAGGDPQRGPSPWSARQVWSAANRRV